MKLAKWILLDVYIHGGDRFSVFGRKNLKTVMLYFKVKPFKNSLFFWIDVDGMKIPKIDTQKQWEKLIGDNK